jgi:hypothetical protein
VGADAVLQVLRRVKMAPAVQRAFQPSAPTFKSSSSNNVLKARFRL